ncbi:hypothetical protein MBAV_000418 [Candidatus Magnetobacterium bavaricum]|uniref:Uncharacterized protein n=1 Tax=Candidatus Magnetobacterium bavaricum TaxID=29290 RepID=A0A0F3H391_9BACT|nr:hypothetical protein MBAV_000418 [Candidatus Magnetobacterium bavaricum]
MAASMTLTIFSPTAEPMLPPMKEKSIAAIAMGSRLMVPVPVITASLRVLFCWFLSRRSR